MNQIDIKSQIQSALPIETYIGRYVSLKKQGKYFKGLCPFHQEKTPSFTVTPEKGMYHCFGCGRGGDVFTFVMEMEGLSFNEALDLLSAFTGIKKTLSSKKNTKYDAMLEINGRCMQLFSDFLYSDEGKTILNYTHGRKLGDEIIKEFHLGASPDSWQFVTNKYSDKLDILQETGLIKKGKSGYYDFFRNRLIFPIQDTAGHVIGFGGRALPGSDNEAKYLNSPESAVFHKGSTLYGLFNSLSAIRSEKEVYVVEGYLDVIGLFQQGIKNVVAPLGTAFTEEHPRILQRHSDKIILVMDGDSAGKKAAFRACNILLNSSSLKTSVILLPEGKDAFDLSVHESRGIIHKVLEQQISSSRFLLLEILFPGWSSKRIQSNEFLEYTTEIKKLYEMNPAQSIQPDMEEKRNALDRLFSFVADLQMPLERDIFLNEGAVALGLDPATVKTEMNKKNDEKSRIKTTGNNSAGIGIAAKIDDPLLKKLIRCERELLAELLSTCTLMGRFLDEIAGIVFYDEHSEILWRYLEGSYTTGNLWSPDDFARFDIPRETMAAFAGEIIRQTEKLQDDRNVNLIVRQLLDRHEEIRLKKEMKTLENQLLVADSVEQEVLMSSYNKLLKELKELEINNRMTRDSEKN